MSSCACRFPIASIKHGSRTMQYFPYRPNGQAIFAANQCHAATDMAQAGRRHRQNRSRLPERPLKTIVFRAQAFPMMLRTRVMY